MSNDDVVMATCPRFSNSSNNSNLSFTPCIQRYLFCLLVTFVVYASPQGHLICTGCGEPNPEDSKVIEPASVGADTAQELEPAAQNVDVPVVETTEGGGVGLPLLLEEEEEEEPYQGSGNLVTRAQYFENMSLCSQTFVVALSRPLKYLVLKDHLVCDANFTTVVTLKVITSLIPKYFISKECHITFGMQDSRLFPSQPA